MKDWRYKGKIDNRFWLSFLSIFSKFYLFGIDRFDLKKVNTKLKF